jgi:hypothetical protein
MWNKLWNTRRSGCKVPGPGEGTTWFSPARALAGDFHSVAGSWDSGGQHPLAPEETYTVGWDFRVTFEFFAFQEVKG